MASSEFTVDTDRLPNRIWFNICEGGESKRGIFEIEGVRLRLLQAGVDDAFPTKFGSDRPDYYFESTEIPADLSRLMEQIPPPKKTTEVPDAPANTFYAN